MTLIGDSGENYLVRTQSYQKDKTEAKPPQADKNPPSSEPSTIFAKQDKDQNEHITKNESDKFSEWANSKDSRAKLNSIIGEAMGETELPSGTNRTALTNHLYSTLSKSVISQLTQTVTDILNSFQGLFVGSEDITGKTEEQVKGLQDSLDQKATQGIADVLTKFDTEYESKVLTITSDAKAEARRQIEDYKPNGKQPEYKSIGERQVNGEKQNVFKAGENYYINRGTTTNPKYEQIFLVDDGGVVGKKKFVTEDTKIQLGLDQNESGDIDINKVKVNGKGDEEISLIRNEGEKVGGHKTYSDAQGNQYIRSNYEYFEMNSDAGLLLQEGGSVEFDDNKEPYIRYNGKSYRLDSDELKTAAEEIRAKNTEIETENLKYGSGVYNADTLLEENVTQACNKKITEAAFDPALNDTEQAQLNDAIKKDIAASIKHEKRETITTNTENAIGRIKTGRENAPQTTTATTPTTSTTSTPQTSATSAPQAGQGSGSVSNGTPAANQEIRSWTGGKMKPSDAQNKAQKDGNFPGNVTGFIENILNSIRTGTKDDELSIEQKDALKSNKEFKQKIITANPSVFNSDGSVKSDAKTSKFDFPSVATMKAFLATIDSTSQSQQIPEQPATTQTDTDIAQQIYDYADIYSGNAIKEKNSAIKMYNHIKDNISSENVVDVWKSYTKVQSDDSSILDSFASEWLSEGEGGGRDAAWKATDYIIGKLKERAGKYPKNTDVQGALGNLTREYDNLKDNATNWINGNASLDGTGMFGMDSNIVCFEPLIDALVKAIDEADKPKKQQQTQEATP